MEHFDVAIIGGGSSGLAALKQLSNLGKQAILLEAGKDGWFEKHIRRNPLLKKAKERKGIQR